MKYFGKFLKSSEGQQIDLQSGENYVAYNNVMHNLAKCFDYDYFDNRGSYDKDSFEDFIWVFTEWLLNHDVNVNEYKNMDFDVKYYLKEYVFDPNSDKTYLCEFYKNVWDYFQSEVDMCNTPEYFLDMYLGSGYPEIDDNILRDNIEDEYEGYDEETYTDIINDIHDNQDTIELVSEEDYENHKDKYLITNKISYDGGYDREEIQVDDSPLEDLNFHKELIDELDSDNNDFDISDYEFYVVDDDLIDFYPNITLYYVINKNVVDKTLHESLDEFSTLFNSRMIKSSDEYFYHSTKQRGLKQFDKNTTTDKAFTGQGAQVHGWGLYLQNDQTLNIRNYKTQLGDGKLKRVPDTIIMDGETFEFDRNEDCWYDKENHDWVKDSLQNIIFTTILSIGNVEDTLKKIEDNIDNKSYRKRGMFKQAIEFINSHEFSYIKQRHSDNGVSQYKVLIPDGSIFITEDEPIGEDIARKIGKDLNGSEDSIGGFVTGKQFYNYIGGQLFDVYEGEKRGDQLASEYLANHGIMGIKYNGYEDGYCCVIFDCSKLKIVGEF